MWADLATEDEVDDSDLLGIDLDACNGDPGTPTDESKNLDDGTKQQTPNKCSTAPEKVKSPQEKEEDKLRAIMEFSLMPAHERRKKRIEEGESPLQVFRGGYLWVSEFSKQAWCEQQMEYTYTVPVMYEEDPVMKAGTEFHLARELAVPDVATVKVKVTSSEDIWAIKVMNLIEAVHSLSTGSPVRREIPIFGSPSDDGTFVIGLIDEIRVDMDTFSFEILELKTRQSRSLPSRAQKVTHNIQVMLYKKLFDDLVRGKVTKEATAKALRLRLEHELGDDILDMAARLPKSPKTLDGLLTHLFERFQGLPFISQCLVEYCYQEDKSTIAIENVLYDDVWLNTKLTHYLNYWHARREVEGVDIEDAWKCQRCDFNETCEWRQRKAEECRNKNSAKSK